MNCYLLSGLLISALLQSAASTDKENIFNLLKMRQVTGSKALATLKTEEEKKKVLQSEGQYAPGVPVLISVQDAFDAGKILAVVSEPYPPYAPDPSALSAALGLQSSSLYEQHMNPTNPNDAFLTPARSKTGGSIPEARLTYINDANGLSDVLLYVTYAGFMSYSLMPLASAPPHIQNMMKGAIKVLQLQNTNIMEIIPDQIASFPNLKRIILTPSTPADVREQNSRRNPGITFEYSAEMKGILELFT